MPVTAGLAGLLLATSAVTARGTELRSSRALDVTQLIQRQQRTLDGLTHDEASLRAQISAATAAAAAGNGTIRELRRKADRLLSELGWHLRVVPTVPHGPHWRLLVHSGEADPLWRPYLGVAA